MRSCSSFDDAYYIDYISQLDKQANPRNV